MNGAAHQQRHHGCLARIQLHVFPYLKSLTVNKKFVVASPTKSGRADGRKGQQKARPPTFYLQGPTKVSMPQKAKPAQHASSDAP